MKVVVIPKRPIPGILPKNKWIDEKMVLDLNRNEVLHCMNFGNVYDESGNIIDKTNIKNVPETITNNKELHVIKADSDLNTEVVTSGYVSVEPVVENNEPVVMSVEPVETEIVAEEPVVEETIEEPVVEEEVPYHNLEVASYTRDGEYINVDIMVYSNTELEGNLYGLFSITNGPKPTVIEYKTADDTWIKFGSKFANFESINNADILEFRFVPKNETPFNFRVLIKESNTELMKLEGTIDPSVIV